MNTMVTYFILITEDILSEAVVKKMVRSVNKNAGRNFEIVNFRRWNKYTIKDRMADINKEAKSFPYFIVTDQDTVDRCPPNAIKELHEPPNPNLLYRFATMEIESWILADREAIAKFLSVPVSKIPDTTDSIGEPKEFIVKLVRRYSPGKIQKKFIPLDRSKRKVGRGYNPEIERFVNDHWNPNIAANHSPSLQRALARLEKFAITSSLKKSP